MFDLLLKNAQVVDPQNGINDVCDVAVENGLIAAVGPDLGSSAREVINFTGLVLQPGIIDSHVHLGTMWGSPFGPKMLAMNGVTTCLDMAGPLDDILDNVPQYGAGINMAILQFASPPFTFKSTTPSKHEMETLIDVSLEQGALGVKLLGGHYPLTPAVSSELIKTALERRAYVAWHAGTTEHGSNIEGMIEAVEMAGGYPLHLAHINAYCRGAIRNEMEETGIAIDLLKKNPNIFCESYISPKNGTRLTCGPDGKIQSKVTGNCLRHFGFSEDRDGVRAALLAKKAFVVYDAGGYSDLVTGLEALKLWEDADSDVGGSFNINPPLPRIALAQAKRDDGSFVVDAISTDGALHPAQCDSVSGAVAREARRAESAGIRAENVSQSRPHATPQEQGAPLHRSRRRHHRLRLRNPDAQGILRSRTEGSFRRETLRERCHDHLHRARSKSH